MSIPFAEKESTEQFLSGGGEMGTLIRNMDWSKTALGPISSWPQSLRTSVSLCLSSTFPILIAWGPETIQIYNDSYRPICGAKHPESMGQNFRICWETALPVVGDKFARGEQGEGTYITDQQMFLDRYGYLEEAFMTFSFAPIRDESGGIGGIFHPITETTEKMLSGRRTQVLRELGAAIGKAKSVQEIATLTQSQYDLYQFDIPFMFFYELKDNTAELLTASGIPAGSLMAPERISLSDSLWPIDDLVAGKEMLEVSGLAQRFGQFSCQPYEEAPHTAIMLPVHISGQAVPFGFIIAGVSARRAPDAAYLNFYSQLAATYNTGISSVYAYEQEQKRAEALAEIDRSKTAFFSNVSHEFRTPLTLMLGPLEELLRQQDMDLHQKLQIEATHRNALRLLKLVNNLLDFSRVEAGRVHAVYQPANLAELTIDLASSFRSIIEKAGMQLHVDCAPLPGNYYADRQMWEKIILNLLSNAFKYTLEGSISVKLTESDKHAVLEVQDTGVGIPEKELPHMFERFHRVENSAGRTHEGSGIGLSLVHELVQLHGGTIRVDSTEGKGSTFTVTIPAGKAHLPTDQVIEDQKTTDSEAIKGAFITEANSLLQDQGNLASADVSKTTSDITGHQDRTPDMDTHILIVDDNYDMRNYLERLLNPYFTVDTAVNGKDALIKIRTKVPHLILSDIMMPVMDGKTMLRHIRSDKRLLQLPVIFLSARAGEEARIDGLRAGADNYLVKPFSAAELLTKVRAQINISKTRGFAEQQLRSLLIQAPVAMAIYRGTDYTIEMANERMLTYWGRTEEQVFDKALFDVIPELQTQGFKELMDKVYQTGERYISGELPLVLHRFGVEDTIYLNITIEALRDVDQQISRLIAVAADVTEQVKARKSLEKVNNTFQLAIEASDMGIWQTNVHTGALQISEIARRIHCIPFNTNISYADALKQLVIPQDTERVHQIIETAIQTKGNFNMDYQINPFDGSAPKWINSTGMVEMNEFGEVTSVIGTILDITEGKKDELRKNDFIGMVSHELKTPLTSLTGYSQLGYRKATKEQDTVHASIYEKINTQLRKMSSMINGFLNVSQLESGKIHLKFSSFPLADLITETVSEVSLTASDQEFIIEGCDISLYADRDKIGTVLTNLLSNAVKYGTKGMPVSIKCTVVEQRVIISVTDKGIGINAAHLDKLFDRYYRVENGQTQHISGFGIGLYLSSEIVLRHHGRIWAESEMGKGTTFYVELPLTH